ncbi:MAG: hypothetical protein CMA62_02070 [Euryarchaeota archaeon]|nr:hypothetical protein [Euryarchaeota archaeon]MBT86291.1 hypothetical protein [Euryarchaeota archaeon]DAC45941.1 MAG TPA: biotin/lipoyl-binding protein [Candidatus Poseidoniales archaeon]
MIDMEWEIPDSDEKFSVDLTEREGMVTTTSVSINGIINDVSEIRISKAGDDSRIILETDRGTRFAHVAKIGDKWWIHLEGEVYTVNEVEKGSKSSDRSAGGLSAPMPGTILEVMVKEGQRVREGQPLMTMEAMKMEHRILAPKSGEVTSINFNQGDRVDMGATLVELGD